MEFSVSTTCRKLRTNILRDVVRSIRDGVSSADNFHGCQLLFLCNAPTKALEDTGPCHCMIENLRSLRQSGYFLISGVRSVQAGLTVCPYYPQRLRRQSSCKYVARVIT